MSSYDQGKRNFSSASVEDTHSQSYDVDCESRGGSCTGTPPYGNGPGIHVFLGPACLLLLSAPVGFNFPTHMNLNTHRIPTECSSAAMTWEQRIRPTSIAPLTETAPALGQPLFRFSSKGVVEVASKSHGPHNRACSRRRVTCPRIVQSRSLSTRILRAPDFRFGCRSTVKRRHPPLYAPRPTSA